MTRVRVVPLTWSLYRRCLRQGAPQDVDLLLDLETGSLSIKTDRACAVTGSGMSERQWSSMVRGVVLGWLIPRLMPDAANKLLKRVAPLAQKALDASTVKRDRQGDLRGRMTDAGCEACRAIDAMCSVEYGNIESWSASLYYGVFGTRQKQCAMLRITADTTDEQLAEIVATEEEQADTDGARVEGLAGYLSGLRDDCVNSKED